MSEYWASLVPGVIEVRHPSAPGTYRGFLHERGARGWASAPWVCQEADHPEHATVQEAEECAVAHQNAMAAQETAHRDSAALLLDPCPASIWLLGGAANCTESGPHDTHKVTVSWKVS